MRGQAPTPLHQSAPERVRFAPSPTGEMHIGGVRTALYNWIVARQSGGKLLIRIEDTDRERSREEHTQELLESLRWMGVDWDEEVVSQSERALRHQEALERLKKNGLLYQSTMSAEEIREKKQNLNMAWRGEDEGEGAWRFRIPDGEDIVIPDSIRPAVFKRNSLDDFAVARSDGTPLYNFAVAVDDMDMRVTTVIRGDDHLSNTPKHLLLIEALGGRAPKYVHLPLILGPDGKKLSKRSTDEQGRSLAVTVRELRAKGYLPEAVKSYIVRLGLGQDEERILSEEELLNAFRINKVSKTGARFDEAKLRNINGLFMRSLSEEEYATRLSVFADRPLDERMQKAVKITQEKAQTLQEAANLTAYLYSPPQEASEKDLKKVLKPQQVDAKGEMISLRLLKDALKELEEMDDFSAQNIDEQLRALAAREEVSVGKIFQPLRLAVTGRTVSPYLHDTLWALGKADTVQRVKAFLNKHTQTSS